MEPTSGSSQSSSSRNTCSERGSGFFLGCLGFFGGGLGLGVQRLFGFRGFLGFSVFFGGGSARTPAQRGHVPASTG